MSHNRAEATVARGQSGRIVIEIDPEVKQRLHSALVLEGQTLKDWFLARVEEYIRSPGQLRLYEGPVRTTDQRPTRRPQRRKTKRR